VTGGQTSGQASESEPFGTDSIISDDEIVFRRLSDSSPNMVAIDAITGVRRPTSGAFKPDDDGVSVYREAKLLIAGLGVADVVRNTLNLVVGLKVGEVRAVQPLDVQDDAWPPDINESDHPRNAAHALITGWDGLTRGERRQRQQALTKVPSLQFVYP
jgi:hypothetical protein